MKLKLKEISDVLLANILAIKKLDPGTIINFLKPQPLDYFYSIWKSRAIEDPELKISDTLFESLRVQVGKECVLAYMKNREFVLILFLDATKTDLWGYIYKNIELDNVKNAT